MRAVRLFDRWWRTWLQLAVQSCALALALAGRAAHSPGLKHGALIVIAVAFAVNLAYIVPAIRAYRRLRESRRPKPPEKHATSNHHQETLPI